MARARHLGTDLYPQAARLQEGQEAMPEQSRAADHGGFPLKRGEACADKELDRDIEVGILTIQPVHEKVSCRQWPLPRWNWGRKGHSKGSVA